MGTVNIAKYNNIVFLLISHKNIKYSGKNKPNKTFNDTKSSTVNRSSCPANSIFSPILRRFSWEILKLKSDIVFITKGVSRVIENLALALDNFGTFTKRRLTIFSSINVAGVKINTMKTKTEIAISKGIFFSFKYQY